MKTLQEMLHARAGGSAQAGVVDVKGGRVRILFGDVGSHRRVVLAVEGNSVSVLHPTDLYRTPNEQADAAAAAIRRKMTPDNTRGGDNLAPNAFAVQALANEHGLEIRDGRLFAGDHEIPLASLAGAMASSQSLATGQTIARPAMAGGEEETGPATAINTAGGPPAGGDEGGNAPAPAPEASGEVDPAAHTKDELVAMAEAEGVEFKAGDTKAEIAEAISAKRAGK